MITITDNPIVINCGGFVRKCEELDPLTHLLLALSSCVAKNLRKFYIVENIDYSKCNITVSYIHDEFLVELIMKNENDTELFAKFVNTITTTDPCTMVKMINTPKRFITINPNGIKCMEINV